MDGFEVIICTVPSKEIGLEIANKLVKDRIAACVNIIPGITSLYEWKNELCIDDELILLIKSRGSLYNKLRIAIEEIHPYEVPEIISLPVRQGNDAYLKWIRDNTAIAE